MGPVERARRGVEALRVLSEIREQGRKVALPEEAAALRGWPGWGPMTPVFAPKDATWSGFYERLGDYLSEHEMELGEQGTYSAFYTPEALAAAMWSLAGRLGFTGGRVGEFGVGRGVFIDTAPDGVEMIGVERDPVTAQIAQLLHPEATIIGAPLQETRLRGELSMVIGNVPFGNVRVFDPNVPSSVRQSLHNYCIYRAVSSVHEGGLVVLLTSRYTMDAVDQWARQDISSVADFVGAIRLPNGALEGGTEALADIVVLRRKVAGQQAQPQSWWDVDRELVGWHAPVNAWWAQHRDMVLGNMRDGDTNAYGLTVAVDAYDDGEPLTDKVLTAGAWIADQATERGLTWRPPVDATEIPNLDEFISEDGKPDNSLRLVKRAGGKQGVDQVINGRWQSVDGGAGFAEMVKLLRIRDALLHLMELEADYSVSDVRLAMPRERLKELYEEYVAKYGYLNRCTVSMGAADPETGVPSVKRTYPTMGKFRYDPDADKVFAIEVGDEDDGVFRPAAILTTRQNVPPPVRTSTDDPATALAWCLDANGGVVDLAYISQLLRVDPETVPELLGDAVYLGPDDRVWVTADEYKSGDVRAKHEVAVKAAKHDPQFQRNVTALEEVLPTWLGPADITANLGAPWIGPKIIEEFIGDLLGGGAQVLRMSSTNQWEVSVGRLLSSTVAASADWGTSKVNAYRLISLALNGKAPVVPKTVHLAGGDTVERKDPDATMLAVEKQQRIRDEFNEWVWRDGERADALCREYNRRYNSLAPRKFNADHLTIHGLAPWFSPYKHQLEYVARAVATPAALCGLPVGAGKTAIMAMTAMTMRRMGLARKPMVVVPNHLIEQTAREFRQLFPAGKFLVGYAKTVAGNRRAFVARCATGDWDAIIISHSAFNAMPVTEATEAMYVREQIGDLNDAIKEIDPEGEGKGGRLVKSAAKARDELKEKIRELRQGNTTKDTGIPFEKTGVDYLLVDEFHYWKSLALKCRTDGFSIKASQRATDMDLKLTWLSQRGSGRYASVFTGTPVSNTMLELYVMLHYLMPDYLREIGLGSADAWAAAYVQFVTTVDVTIDGSRFEMRTKPALFVNAPELRLLLSQVADIRTDEQLGLWKPKADLRVVVCEPTDVQREYTEDLVSRADEVRSAGWNTTPGADNMLKICTDGRRMATDPALVGLDDDGMFKLHHVAKNMIEVYQDHPGKLQVGFLDMGTPNKDKGTQSYGRLRKLLIAEGIPAERIRFAHDATTDIQKKQLYADCWNGKVSVILGSTDKLGVGTNIQRLIIALHHIDAPFRPSDVEQRDGRGLRPKNIHDTVLVFRYVTQRTFDAYMWQLLTRKIGFIKQVVSGQLLSREVEDITPDDVLSFAAIKASATGQPLLMEKAELEMQIKKLKGLERGHRNTVNQMRRGIPKMKLEVAGKRDESAAWAALDANAGDMVEGDEELLKETMKGFHQWRQPRCKVAGVEVTFREWKTIGKDIERHPLMVLNAGGGEVEYRVWRHWTAQGLADKFMDLINGAAQRSKTLMEAVARTRVELEHAEAMVDKPFDKADELARLQAKLARVMAKLEAAAQGIELDDDDDDLDEPIVPLVDDHGSEGLAESQERDADDAEAGERLYRVFDADAEAPDDEPGDDDHDPDNPDCDCDTCSDRREAELAEIARMENVFGEFLAAQQERLDTEFADLFGAAAQF
jgi:N12 class adenine-specific DNA methylase